VGGQHTGLIFGKKSRDPTCSTLPSSRCYHPRALDVGGVCRSPRRSGHMSDRNPTPQRLSPTRHRVRIGESSLEFRLSCLRLRPGGRMASACLALPPHGRLAGEVGSGTVHEPGTRSFSLHAVRWCGPPARKNDVHCRQTPTTTGTTHARGHIKTNPQRHSRAQPFPFRRQPATRASISSGWHWRNTGIRLDSSPEAQFSYITIL